ncbi:hypothetical protein [Gemmiger formicilis]|uniref:hypothetical protein n=1 Tax=Gemmiger formicilis TaxID=745368 RepID=UPI003CF15F83
MHGTSRFFTFPAAAASATIEKEPSPAGTPDSSQRCTLFACRFATGDDMVAIKSGKNPEGNRIGRPCRDGPDPDRSPAAPSSAEPRGSHLG